MVLNEKALLREMKEAYKGGGYTVITTHGETTLILTPAWAVEINNENLPREVLSLLALHMGYLPEDGEAYKILRANKEPTVQKMIYETALLMVRKLELPLKGESIKGTAVKKTLLTFDGCNVWQKTGNNGIVLLDPEYESILRKKEDAVMAGNAIYKEGEVSKAYIFRAEAAKWESQLNHLAQIPWVAK